MLPPELLKVVFGALSRDDLDALMSANVSFRDIVLRDFAKEPLRYFEALNIYEAQSYTFVPPRGNEYTCGDDEDFHRRMRHARVGRLAFWTYRGAGRGPLGLLFDEETFQVLLSLKNAWRDGHIITPRDFASPSVFYRAFSELFLCKSMVFNTDVDGGLLRQPFMSLPVVRECTFVRILLPPGPVSTAEILDWLKVDAASNEPKHFEVVDYPLLDSVENLVQNLKTDFIQAKNARCYVVTIVTAESACAHLAGRFINKNASKVLTISLETSGKEHFVAVEVKPMDEK